MDNKEHTAESTKTLRLGGGSETRAGEQEGVKFLFSEKIA